MILSVLVAALIALAPVVYVAIRKLSVVEQQITFETPQQGVSAVEVVVKEDLVRRLRIVYTDGRVCEVFPEPAPSRPAGLPQTRSSRVDLSCRGV